MRRTWLLWTMFGLCLAVVLAAMAWISLTVLRLDRTELEARRHAQVEENVRLALWRMDSALATLVSQETARPYFAYSAFTPAERAYTRMFNEIQYGDVLVPSPLLTIDSPLILLHFQFDPDGNLTSPQVPTGQVRELAIRHYTSEERIEQAGRRLEEIRQLVQVGTLLAQLPAEDAPLDEPMPLLGINVNNDAAQQPLNTRGNYTVEQQQQRSQQEFQARNTGKVQANLYELNTNRLRQSLDPVRVSEGVLKPLWMGQTLLLARRVSINRADYVQGCWMNWPAIRSWLLESVRDLLPNASLEPSESQEPEKQPRRLAALPLKLSPGALPFAPEGEVSPIRMTLGIAWACVLAGSAAVGLLLWGAMSLSERRAAFVSAVTHELRTPLTTVSMYAEMLEEGMVSSEATRREYLGTLRTEAGRLGHLVENVLAYSRIERGRGSARIQEIPVCTLVEAVKGRLEQRAAQAGLALAVEIPQEMCSLHVRADVSAVEQILFNLVDNAGKYASHGEDRRLHLEAERNGRAIYLRVRDHGPGISDTDRCRLFRPFSKSARDAANSAPGVGLGLALSRQLARQMGGNLKLEQQNGHGACFTLRLPVAV